MTRIVECVPNFSEGRDRQTLDALREAVTSTPGVRLLDVQTDSAHHRSVFTFIGPPEASAEAAFRAVRVATERIDLNHHRGEHPRMGATDVIPFVPVEDVTMDECVALARALGQRVGDVGIPVFLYARAATRPDRESLPQIRKGEFEELRRRIGSDPDRTPDFGPHQIHPTAGCTAIGARPFLVAYNIYLDTPNVTVAEAIAKEIRTSSGGFPAVQARGFEVGGRAQVSMNLLDIDVTPPHAVFKAVQEKAVLRDTAVHSSEIVGLIPERAIHRAGAQHLRLQDQVEEHLLEPRVRQSLGPQLDEWMDQLASGAPTPGGGSAAALAGVMAASLVAMVGRLTTSRKAYAGVAEEFAAITTQAEGLRAQLRQLVDRDAASYDGVMSAYRLPKGGGAEQAHRQEAIDQALLHAARVPLETARAAAALLLLARRAAEAGNRNSVCDAGVAALLAEGALRGAVYNVEVNVRSLSNPQAGAELAREAR
ncbi:MAG TPA: glutamate formimidoyltransferase, partial [Gemmatimonadales bacterium]|nr:glutamate formimidoyltransferase [Gemmatimonadales bacterium]